MNHSAEPSSNIPGGRPFINHTMIFEKNHDSRAFSHGDEQNFFLSPLPSNINVSSATEFDDNFDATNPKAMSEQIFSLKKMLWQTREKNVKLEETNAELLKTLSQNNGRSRHVSQEHSRFLELFKNKYEKKMAVQKEQTETVCKQMQEAELKYTQQIQALSQRAAEETEAKLALEKDNKRMAEKLDKHSGRLEELEASLKKKEYQLKSLSANLKAQAAEIDHLTVSKLELMDQIQAMTALAQQQQSAPMLGSKGESGSSYASSSSIFSSTPSSSSPLAPSPLPPSAISPPFPPSPTHVARDSKRGLAVGYQWFLVHATGNITHAGERQRGLRRLFDQDQEFLSALQRDREMYDQDVVHHDVVQNFMRHQLASLQTLMAQTNEQYARCKHDRNTIQNQAFQVVVRKKNHSVLQKSLYRWRFQSFVDEERTRRMFRAWRFLTKINHKHRVLVVRQLVDSVQHGLLKMFQRWKGITKEHQIAVVEHLFYRDAKKSRKNLNYTKAMYAFRFSQIRARAKKAQVFRAWSKYAHDRGYKLTTYLKANHIIQTNHHRRLRKRHLKHWIRATRTVIRRRQATHLVVNTLVKQMYKSYRQAAWRRWARFTSEQRLVQQLYEHDDHELRLTRLQTLKRCASRYKSTALLRAFNTWRTTVKKNHIRALQFKVQTLLSKANTNQMTAVRIVNTWRSNTRTYIFQAWKKYAHTRALRKKELLAKIYSRLKNQSLANAYRAWNRLVLRSHENQFRQRVDRSKAKYVKSIVNKMKRDRRAAFFLRWKAYAKERGTLKRHALLKAVSRATRRFARRAFQQWRVCSAQHMIMKLRQDKYAAGAAWVRRQRIATMRPCFEAWMKYTKRGATLIADEKRRDQELKIRKRMLTERVLFRLARGNLGKAFTHWIAFTKAEEQRELKEQIERNKLMGAARMIKNLNASLLVKCFDALYQNASTRVLRRKALVKMVAWRFKQRYKHAALAKWKRYVKEAGKYEMIARIEFLQDSMEKRKMSGYHRLIERWQNQSKTSVFSRWKRYTVASRSRRRVLLDQLLKRTAAIGLSTAFYRWKIRSDQDKDAEYRLATMRSRVRRYRFNVRVSHFNAWRHYVRSQRSMRELVLGHSCTRVKQSLQAQALLKWKQHTDQDKQWELSDKINAWTRKGVPINQVMKLALQEAKRLSCTDAPLTDWIVKTVKKHCAYRAVYRAYHRNLSMALRTWKRNADADQRREHLVHRLINYIQQQTLHRGFDRWHRNMQHAKVEKRRTAQIDSMTRLRQMSTLVPVFREWRKAARDQNQARLHTVERMSTLLSAACLRQSLNTWHSAALRMHTVELENRVSSSISAYCRVILRKWQSNSARSLFGAWKAYAHEQARRKRTLFHSILARRRRQLLRLSLGLLKHNVQATKEQEHQNQMSRLSANILSSLRARSTKDNIVYYFTNWREHTLAEQARRERTASILFRMANQNVLAAFRRWKEHSQQQQQAADRQKAAMRAIMMWQRESLAGAFRDWSAWVDNRKRRKVYLAERMMNHFRHRFAKLGLVKWKEYVEESNVRRVNRLLQETKLSMMVRNVRMSNQHMVSQMFRDWRAYTKNNRIKRIELMSRACQRLVSRSKYIAFSRWKNLVSMGRLYLLKRHLFRSKYRHWRQKRMRAVMYAWSGAAKQSRVVRESALKSVLQRRHASGMSTGWQKWREFTHTQRLQHLYLHAKAKIYQRRLQSSAYHTWRVSATKNRKHRLQLMKTSVALTQSCNRKLLLQQKLGQWRVNAVKAELEPKIQLLSRESMTLTRRLTRVQDVTIFGIKLQARNRRAMKAAFQWRKFAKQRAQMRRAKEKLVQRVLIRMAHSKVWLAWRQWSLFVDNAQVADLKMKLQTQNATLRQAKAATAQAAIRRWRSTFIMPLFSRWKNYVQQKRERKIALTEMVMRRWRYKETQFAFAKWRHYAGLSKIQEMQADFETMKKAFQTERRVLQGQVKEQKHYAGMQAIKKWRAMTLIPCFERWAAYTRARRVQKRQVLTSTLKRMANNKLWSAWRQWIQHVEECKVDDLKAQFQSVRQQFETERKAMKLRLIGKHRQLVKNVVEHWKTRRLVPAFSTWLRYARGRKLMKRQALIRACNRIEHISKWAAWRQWMAQVEHARIMEVKESLLMNAETAREEYATLRATTQVQLETQRRKAGQQALKRRHFKVVVSHFHAWKQYTRKHRTKNKTTLRKMVARFVHQRKYAAWRSWMTYVEAARVKAYSDEVMEQQNQQRREKKERVMQMMSLWKQDKLKVCWEAWREYVADRKTRRAQGGGRGRGWSSASASSCESISLAVGHLPREEVLVHALTRVRAGVISHSWLQWREFVHGERATSMEEYYSKQRHMMRRKLLNTFYSSKVRMQESASTTRVFLLWRALTLNSKFQDSMQLLQKDNTQLRVSKQRTRKLEDELKKCDKNLSDLRNQMELDGARLRALTRENVVLKRNLASATNKIQTQNVFAQRKQLARADFFQTNASLCRAFRQLYDYARLKKTRRQAVAAVLARSQQAALRTGLLRWRRSTQEWARVQLESSLSNARRRISALLEELAASSSASFAAEESARMASMSAKRELELMAEIASLNSKIGLLMAEVKERGNHVQFLIDENNKLSSLCRMQASNAVSPRSHPYPHNHIEQTSQRSHYTTMASNQPMEDEKHSPRHSKALSPLSSVPLPTPSASTTSAAGSANIQLFTTMTPLKRPNININHMNSSSSSSNNNNRSFSSTAYTDYTNNASLSPTSHKLDGGFDDQQYGWQYTSPTSNQLDHRFSTLPQSHTHWHGHGRGAMNASHSFVHSHPHPHTRPHPHRSPYDGTQSVASYSPASSVDSHENDDEGNYSTVSSPGPTTRRYTSHNHNRQGNAINFSSTISANSSQPPSIFGWRDVGE